MEIYDLDLEFTKVTSPIDGQISRYYLTPGNLVNQDQTLLTTIVSLDPVHAYFDMSIVPARIRKAINEGRIERGKAGITLPVLAGLQGGENFRGWRDRGTSSTNNKPDHRQTGASSPNPEPKGGGIHCCRPGCSCGFGLPIGTPISRCW